MFTINHKLSVSFLLGLSCAAVAILIIFSDDSPKLHNVPRWFNHLMCCNQIKLSFSLANV